MSTGRNMYQAGRFTVGVNYWASHAGLFMWRKWDEEVVRRDLVVLAEHGFTMLRVFPLWPDFQPLHALRGFEGALREYRIAEDPASGSSVRDAGLDEVMLDRFDILADEAERVGLSLNVALITGWMSGRLFVPPAFEGRNPLTDPVARYWEIRFVTAFVSRFSSRVALWDLGNEVNCMGTATREQAWLWTNEIVAAVRREDPAARVASGMDDLTVDGPWRIADQGELVDVMTTHPYSEFIPHCDLDGADAPRTVIHPAAQSCYYADLSNRPVLCQEVNTLGPVLAGPDQMCAFASASAWLLLAHGVTGMLWWCAFDQDQLHEAPYDWNALERELGLFTREGNPHPVAQTLGDLAESIRAIEETGLDLTNRVVDACCLLSAGQDHWAVAYSAFVLAARAGRSIRFVYAEDGIPEANTYLLPSVTGHEPISRRRWQELQARVREGATLAVSLDAPFLSEFSEVFGLQPLRRRRRRGSVELRVPDTLQSSNGDTETTVEVPFEVTYQTEYRPAGAEILTTEADGTPAWTRNDYGGGTVYLLTVPLERGLADVPGAFGGHVRWERFYSVALDQTKRDRWVVGGSPELIITEHPQADGSRAVVAVNPSAVEIRDRWTLDHTRTVTTVHGTEPEGDADALSVCVAPHDSLVLRVASNGV